MLQPTQTRIDIYNVAGQKVRTLINNQIAPGSHTILFNGLDDDGEQLSCGTYILNIKQDANVICKAIVLIK